MDKHKCLVERRDSMLVERNDLQHRIIQIDREVKMINKELLDLDKDGKNDGRN